MVRLFRAKTNQALSVSWLFFGSEGNPFRVIGGLDEDTIMTADVFGARAVREMCRWSDLREIPSL